MKTIIINIFIVAFLGLSSFGECGNAVANEIIQLNAIAQNNLVLAKNAIARLDAIIKAGEVLSAEDQVWLTNLQKTIGRESMEIADPDDPTKTKNLDCRLTVENINAAKGQIEVLYKTLCAATSATYYNPAVAYIGGVVIPVHNSELLGYLKGNYSVQDFDNLLQFLATQETFNEIVNEKTGLVQTASLEEGENPEMVRQWVTDTIRCGDLEKYQHPQEWPLALLTLAKFYNQKTEIDAFSKAIDNPDSYRNGDAMEGVAHIFMPETLQRDTTWFNNKRLESHGLALKGFCDAIIDGLSEQKKWGFKTSMFQEQENFNFVVTAISNLASYFMAIQYYDAPSAGPWEETPFPGGLTWDTEAIRSGLESLQRLMFGKELDGNDQIAKIRQALKETPRYSLWGQNDLLQKAIDAGRKKVVERLVQSAQPMENPNRPVDSSLVFVSGSTIHLDDNLLADIKAHFNVLEFAEKQMVRNNGIIRYAPFFVTLKDGSRRQTPDSYMAKNYWIGFDSENKLNLQWQSILAAFGSKDASDVDVFVARAKMATPDTEAEWFMVSEIAYGYSYQTSRLLKQIKDENRKPTDNELELIRHGILKANQFINRGLARITPECPDMSLSIKSNGRVFKGFLVPEAYETVSTLDPEKPSRKIPGTNTPLAWARASLFRATQTFKATLEASVGLEQ